MRQKLSHTPKNTQLCSPGKPWEGKVYCGIGYRNQDIGKQLEIIDVNKN